MAMSVSLSAIDYGYARFAFAADPPRLDSRDIRNALSYARGLVKSGWTRGGGERGRHCIGESILRGFRYTSEHTDWSHPVFQRVLAFVSMRTNDPHCENLNDMFSYNDNRFRKMSEILSLIDDVGNSIFGTGWLDVAVYDGARRVNLNERLRWRHILRRNRGSANGVINLTHGMKLSSSALSAMMEMLYQDVIKDTVKDAVKQTVVKKSIYTVLDVERHRADAQALLANIGSKKLCERELDEIEMALSG